MLIEDDEDSLEVDMLLEDDSEEVDMLLLEDSEDVEIEDEED